MSIVPIVGLALVAVVLLAVVRGQRPELGALLAVAAGSVIALAVLPRLAQVIQLLEGLSGKAGVDQAYLTAVLKIVGVAYVAEFGAQVARDAGEGAIARQVELAGKVLILVLAVPIVLAVLDLVLRLLREGF